MKKLKVLIKGYGISKDKKLIKLLLKDLEDDNKKEFEIALLSEELGPMFGIGVIQEERLVKKMLEGVNGKKVNLEMHAFVNKIDVDGLKNSVTVEDKLMQHHSQLDYFPYHELLNDMQEEKNED